MSINPKILAIATITPSHNCSMAAAVAQSQVWTAQQDQAFQAKVRRIFRHAEVEQRYSILPLSEIFSLRALEEKNGLYRDAIVELSELALRAALKKARLNPNDIDCLITTSCTGHMSPSFDAYLMDRLELKKTVQRLPVMEMGCIGGAVGLIYAENYLRAYPDRYVALISAELTSITFQRDDFSWANIVSTAIFGDGIACAILGPSQENRPALLGSVMHHFPNSIDMLGFHLRNSGFHMVLDERLPALIREQFPNFTQPLLEEHHLSLEAINHYIVHPGGKKILRNIESILRPYGKNIEDSWQVFRQYGNMSSATILFILERFLEKPVAPGEKGMLMAFGPGLSAAVLLLEWRE